MWIAVDKLWIPEKYYDFLQKERMTCNRQFAKENNL